MNVFKDWLSGLSPSTGRVCSRNRKGQAVAGYQRLEKRNLLATFTVNTASDVVDLNDELVSLREAITAANTNAVFGDADAGEATGDVINFDTSIAGGVIELHGSEIEITDALLIRGSDVTIEAGFQSRIFAINTAETVRLSNLIFSNGNEEHGGAILSLGGGTLRIKDSQFLNNQSFSRFRGGGGIHKDEGQLLIANSKFADNFSNQRGGAIYHEDGSLNIQNSTFTKNAAEELGGAIYSLRTNIVVNGTMFVENIGRQSAGAIHSVGDESTTGIFSNTSFEGNRSETGSAGAMSVGLRGGTYVLESTFRNNKAGRTQRFLALGYGGAISSSNSDLTIKDSLISGNISAWGGGGGVRHVNGSVRIISSEITNNRSLYSGGGVSTDNADLTIVDSVVEKNRAVNVIEGMRIFDDSSGGGVFFRSNNDENFFLIRGSSVSGNITSKDGGGIYSEGGSASVIDSNVENNAVTSGRFSSSGGGLAATGKITVLRTKIARNRLLLNSLSEDVAVNGGGLSFTTGQLRVTDSEIVANYSAGNGGGISIRGGRTVLSNTIVGAESGGGNFAGEVTTSKENHLLGNGGGIFLTGGGSLRFAGGQISKNVALNGGGGIFASRESSVVTSFSNPSGNRVRVIGNRALRFDGGGLSVTDSFSVLYNVDFENNSARGGAAIATSGGSLRLANVTNTNNFSRRDDGGYQIDEDANFTQTAAMLREIDFAIADLDDVLTIA